jgi:hypothetical protein
VFLACVTQEGGRRLVGVIVGSAILMYVLTSKRSRIKASLAALAGTIVLLIGMEIVLQNRNHGFGEFEYQQVGAIDVDFDFLRLCQLYEIFPAELPHTGIQAVIYTVARPIPRVIWENKPIDIGFDLAKYLGYENVGFTLSIIGEAYVSWGFPAILATGLLVGRLCAMWQRLENATALTGYAMYAFLCMDIFDGIRSGIELVLMFYPVIFWIVVDAILRLFGGGGHRVPARSPRLSGVPAE